MNVGFQQLRDAVFARVVQRALRMLALETFEHIHRPSMRYHITRKTGGLSRVIERGVKGVEFLLRSVGTYILNYPTWSVNQRDAMARTVTLDSGVNDLLVRFQY